LLTGAGSWGGHGPAVSTAAATAMAAAAAAAAAALSTEESPPGLLFRVVETRTGSVGTAEQRQ